MHPRLGSRLRVLALVALAAGGSVRAATPPASPPQLTVVLAVKAPADQAITWPTSQPLTASADPTTARQARRAAAVRRLEAAGDLRLAPLLASLAPLIRSGQVQVLQRYPAFGMVAVKAPPRLLEALRGAPGLRDLWAVEQRRLAGPPMVATHTQPRPRPAAGRGSAGPMGISPAPQADHLSRIGAPAAWNRLGGLGEGLVIGVIDSGADGRHPILAGSFRGRRARRLDRDWVDLTAERRREPSDGNGHGTHVTGLAVGAEGDQAWGAAPGAEWIAARAFDAEGKTDDLTLLAAADWMLHPGGGGMPPDPAQAPDIVNLSWTLDNGADDRFRPVLQAFRFADILSVCATGNLEDLRDPWPRLMAPASYPEALAVGALSRADQPWLWGRLGPGFFGGVKPQLLAPGEAVWSALPDGETGTFSGSSMAAPLAAGAAAVVWGQAPGLRAHEVATLLSASARDLGAPGADADLGWGRLDLAAATVLAQRMAWVEGVVGPAPQAGAAGRPGATLSLVPPADWTPAWRALLGRATADATGAYRLIAPEGRYLLRVSHPLFQPLESEVVLRAGQGTRLDPQLTDAALAQLQGRVRGAWGAPLAGATLRLAPPGDPQTAGDPETAVIAVVSAADGSFRQPVPPGTWQLRTAAEAHRTLTTTLVLDPGSVRTVDLTLSPAPRILLVDADAWDNERIAPYLSRALDDAGLPHVRRDILAPHDLPSSDRLAAADLLWWAHAYQSPGRLDQERRDRATVLGLSAYLAGGGHLLLSGQDVALWDQKRGLAKAFFDQATGIRQSRDRTTGTPTGLEGLDLLGGLPLNAAWAGGAAKIRYAQPDSLDLDAASATRAVLRWSDGSAAAVVRAGDAAFPGRRAFLGFGPESAGGRLALAQVVDRLAQWMTPPDLRLEPTAATVMPGQTLTMTLRLRGGGDGDAGEADVALLWPSPLDLTPAGGLRLDGTRRAGWRGRLAAGEERRFDLGLRLSTAVTGAMTLPLQATLRMDGRERRSTSLLQPQVPDLRGSRFSVRPSRLPAGGGRATLNLTLLNDGPAAAASALVTVTVPVGLVVDPASLRASGGQAALNAADGRITWRGGIPSGGSLVMDWAAAAPAGPALHAWAAVVAVPGMARLPLVADQRVGGPRLRIAHLEPTQVQLAAGEILDLGLALANDGETAEAAALDLQATGADAAGWSILDPPNGRWSGSIPAGGTVGLTLRLRAPVAPRAAEAGILMTVDDGLSPAAPVTGTTAIDLGWPDLGASLSTFEPAAARAGDLVSITLRLANSGSRPADAVATDLLPPNLVPLPEGISVSAGAVERQPGQLRWRCKVAAGAEETLRYSARVGGSGEPNRFLTRTVRIDGGGDTLVISPTLDVNPWRWSAALETWPGGAVPGGMVTQVLSLRGQGLAPPRSVTVTILLPRALAPDQGSLPPGLTLEADGRSLRYDGPLASDGALRLSWRASVAQGLEPGGLLFTGARISAAGMPTLDLGHHLAVSVADWSRSSLTASRLLLEPGQATALRLLLDNAGPRADRADLALVIPSGLDPDPASLGTDGGAPAAWDAVGRRLTWQGDLSSGGRVAIHLRARRDPSAMPPDGDFLLTMVFSDGRGIQYRRDLKLAFPRARLSLPWLAVERR